MKFAIAVFAAFFILPAFFLNSSRAGDEAFLKNEILTAVDGSISFTVSSDPSVGISASHQGDRKAPMQSVFKFPLALAILHEVDQGKLTLDQPVKVEKQQLLPNTWSPLRDKNPNGGTFPLSELLTVTVAESDNNACDILISLLGGTQKLNDYIRNEIGIDGINIVYNEKEMHEETSRQYENFSTSNAMNELLRRFADGNILTPESTKFLMNVMRETKTGTARIKGKLPKNIPVAHKTGSSGTNVSGFTAATNDVGIILISEKERMFISVFISDSMSDSQRIEETIADIALHYYQAANKNLQSKKQ